MRVLLDTNVVLDLLLDRQPWAGSAETLVAAVEAGRIHGFLCSTTLTTIYYLTAKAAGDAQARAEIRRLLALFDVADVNKAVLESALRLDFPDFEDAVLYEAALQAGVETLVTRDRRGFREARLQVLEPPEACTLLGLSKPRG